MLKKVGGYRWTTAEFARGLSEVRLYGLAAFVAMVAGAGTVYSTPTQNVGTDGSWIAYLGGEISDASTGGQQGVLRPSWNTPVDGFDDGVPEPAVPSTGPITVSLSESEIDNDFSGIIEITISGLSSGQDVLVERFRIANADGVVDSNAVLQQSYRMVDGFFERQGIEYNFNIPNDYTDADGEIIAQLDFWSGSIGNVPGEYVYRVSSPGGHFDDVSAPLTISEVGEDQFFYGSVSADGYPVEDAIVAMLDPLGEYKEYIRAVVTDSDGNYFLDSPYPGEFDLVAVKPGYVGDFGDEIEAFLDEGGVTEKHFELTPGDRSISGVLVDSVSGDPLPGVLLTVLSVDDGNAIIPERLTVAWTDQNGEFDIPVTAGLWGIFLRLNEAAEIGYLVPSRGPLVTVDATNAGASDIVIPLVRGTTLIAGTLASDDFNETPLGGVQVIAYNQDRNQAAWGVTEGEGRYRIAVGPGRWSVGPFSYTMELVEHSGATSYDVFFNAPNQSIEVDFTARERIAEVYGFVTDPADEVVGKLPLVAVNVDSDPREVATQSTYASDGYYNFYFSEGRWAIFPDAVAAARRSLLFKNLPVVEIDWFGESEVIENIETQEPTATIRFSLTNGDGRALPNVVVQATAQIGTDRYLAHALTDETGVAELPVLIGNWEVTVDPAGLRLLGQEALAPVTVNVDKALALSGQVTNLLGSNGPIQVALNATAERNLLTGIGQPGQRFAVEASLDLESWYDLGRVSVIDGGFSVDDEIGPIFESVFYRFRNE